ncbi:MAG: hypothetical protein ISN26_06160 [Betaproteobacteria bacterium AqS2]|uniref:YhdP central domain-containing protein n=1 Tax=Candidatus Amphirhobacter heronislandensis TaxID=1732024 RepID=A0A930Y1R7_9GAMM|nr:hypothetical protein [Betaproteobacteria bacterium AqS2]
MGRALAWIWRIKIWVLVAFFVLVIAIKTAVFPYVFEPVARQSLGLYSAALAARLGEEVEIGFDEIAVSLGTRAVFIAVTEPYFRVGAQTTRARRALWVYGYQQPPVLVLDQANAAIVRYPGGAHVIGGVDPALLQAAFRDIAPQLLSRPAGGAMLPPLPSLLIATDAHLSYAQADDAKPLRLPVTTFALRPAADDVLQVSFHSLQDASWSYFGRLNLPRDLAAGRAGFYVSAREAGSLLRRLGLPNDAERLSFEAWGEIEAGSRLSVYVEAAAAAATHAGGTEGQGYAAVTGPARLQLRAAATDAFGPARRLRADWAVNASAVRLRLPPAFLDGEVALAALEGGGGFAWDAAGWRLRARDVRFTGPPGTGGLRLNLARDAAGVVAVDFAGSAPQADLAAVTALLPSALSPRGVAYMRERLRAGKAQLRTIAVAAPDVRGFPWADGAGGRFTLEAHLYDAEVDYATGYPLLRDAAGSFGIAGSRLAVTVAGGEVAGASLRVARVGIDDLQAAAKTIYAAVDAQLPPDGLDEVLLQLPPTRAKAAELLEAVEPLGSQRLLLTVAVPVDGGEASASGALELGAGSALLYRAATVTATALRGRLAFRDGAVAGVLGGRVFDTPAQLSLALDAAATEVEISGEFDLDRTLARLGRPAPVPLQGASALTARLAAGELSVASDLRGTAIELPAPFGKEAAAARELRLRIDRDATRLAYGDGLARALLPHGGGGTALAFGPAADMPAAPAAGTRGRGEIAGVDLDALLAGGAAGGMADAQPLELELALPQARLLGMEHPVLTLRATVAATATVAALASERLRGAVAVGPQGTVRLSLAELRVPAPADEDEDGARPSPAPTPALPPLDARIDLLTYKDKSYMDVHLRGAPAGGVWTIAAGGARFGATEFSIAGSTGTAAPATELLVRVESPRLDEFVAGYAGSDGVAGGTGRLSGALRWDGSLFSPDYHTLAGTLAFAAEEIVVTRDSGGARLLNLLSPFTLLNTLPDLGLEGTRFATAAGEFAFADGDLIINSLEMDGDEVNISASGSTSLITEVNDIDYSVELASSDTLTAGAVSFVNPLAGALLLVFGNVLDAPLLGRIELNYKVAGTWDEPEVITQAEADE